MRFTETLRLVWLNLSQNKFKVLLTSIGIVVGAATIVMVIAIGRGSKEEVAEQFKNLNAGAIDISFEQSSTSSSGNSNGQFGFSGMMPGGGMGKSSNSSGSSNNSSSNSSSRPSSNGNSSAGNSIPGGNFGGEMGKKFGSSGSSSADERMNQETITLTTDDMEDLETFVPDLSSVSISYSTKQSVEGGELDEAQSYTIGGVLDNYIDISNLSLSIGEFITQSNEENKEKICVLGASAAKEIFGDATSAYASEIYIDGRPYVINGVLEEVGTVASGISPDEAIFIPYRTGMKYLSGTDISPTITVIAADVDNVDTVVSNIETVLAETYPNTEFTITDAGSKMEAASASNEVLSLLLYAMAAIVFAVGGIGIMNVLFVTVKERTKEIGILKSMGCKKRDILMEFLLEACSISVLGGILGVGLSLVITPIVKYFGVSVSLSVMGALLALLFAVFTGTVFGFYPAFKASRLIPVEALSEE